MTTRKRTTAMAAPTHGNTVGEDAAAVQAKAKANNNDNDDDDDDDDGIYSLLLKVRPSAEVEEARRGLPSVHMREVKR